MKYANQTNFILSIERETVHPFSVTRDYSTKELESNPELASLVLRGVLTEFNGEMPKIKKNLSTNDPRFETDDNFTDGHEITKVVNGVPVTYVVADGEGSDAVEMMDDTVVTSLGKDVHKSPDYIEKGVDARKHKNGADAMEASLKKEFEESQFDDEDNLSDNEPERNEALDVDHAIDEDTARFITKQSDKNGAQETTLKNVIETEVAKGLNAAAQEIAKNLDEGEHSDSADGKMVDFLKQPLNTKKYIISKETDKNVLSEINKTTGSQAVKKLVNQRLRELK